MSSVNNHQRYSQPGAWDNITKIGANAFNECTALTGTNTVKGNKKDDDNVYYTLTGVRVINPTENGIYIKNGRKVIIR